MGLKTTASVLATPFATTLAILLIVLALLVGGTVEVVDGDRVLKVGDITVPLTQTQHAGAIIGNIVMIVGTACSWAGSTVWLVFKHVALEHRRSTANPGTETVPEFTKPTRR